MKKNWILRLGLLAMVLTLVTMPMVSSTYAKYVTAATATDTARVAKWGVTISANTANLFGDAYEDGVDSVKTTWSSTPSAASITVNAAVQGQKVLAPGTTGSFTFTITGTPEVAVDLDVAATITPTGWTVLAANDYQPVKFTFSNGTKFWDGDSWEAGSTPISAAQLQAGILSLDNSAVNPNTNLATMNGGTGNYTVNWVWPFTVAGFTTLVKDAVPDPDVFYSYDEADTILGNLGTAPTLAITLTITATQIN